MRILLLGLIILLSIFRPVFAGNDDHLHSSHVAPFIENKGQWDNNLLFRSDFGGGKIFLHKDKFRFGFINHDDLEILNVLHHDQSEGAEERLNKHIFHGHIYDMGFVNANKNPEIFSFEKQNYHYNYFLGNDQSKWAGDVGLYGQVLYKGLWNGIDLKIKEDNGAYEYDFIVEPLVKKVTIII